MNKGILEQNNTQPNNGQTNNGQTNSSQSNSGQPNNTPAVSPQQALDNAVYHYYVQIDKYDAVKHVTERLFYQNFYNNNLGKVDKYKFTQEYNKFADERDRWISKSGKLLGEVWIKGNLKSYWMNLGGIQLNQIGGLQLQEITKKAIDPLIERIINEKFASKAQQRFFYAKADEKGATKKEKKKWSKWAKEFSDDTNFKKLPEKVKKHKNKKLTDVDEIVDSLGNIATGKMPTDANTKGITQKETTDEVVKTGGGEMGIHGVHGTHTSLRYWAESDMSKALGYEKTLGKDEDYKNAEEYFTDELGMDKKDAEERMAQLGYDKKLAKEKKDKVRLVENPKQFMEDYIDEILLKKGDIEELISREEKEINPIIKKQLASLKKIMKNNNLTINDVVKYLKKDE